MATGTSWTDPEAWAILQTIQDTRELADPFQVEMMLGLFALASVDLPSNGPMVILATCLRRLGWGIGSQGLVQDRFGIFSLMHAPWDEVVFRLKLNWGVVLGVELSHRPTFQGIDRVDLPEIHHALRQFGATDSVFPRCHLDGTLFTQNARARFQVDTSSACPWCASKDGFHHRAWVCPHFSSCRSHLTSQQLAVLPDLPACLRDHGWPVILPEWEVFAGLLLRDDRLFWMSPVCPPKLALDQCYELFVESTTAHPTDVKLRYAAWVVTVAAGMGEWDNQVPLGGHVKGLCQSPYRAELSAVLGAIRWAHQMRAPVRIWCRELCAV